MSDWLSDREHRLTLLRGLIACSILSTGIHFTHNFLYVDEYPQSSWFPNSIVQVAVIITWPALTFSGLRGYRLYREGRYETANLLVGLYAGLGIFTLGHFTAGNPQIPPFFYATIFTDGLAGFALVAFALWSTRAPLAVPSPARG